jgi:hypothetical protein
MQVILPLAGKDATEAFVSLHSDDVLRKYANLCVGTVKREKVAKAAGGLGEGEAFGEYLSFCEPCKLARHRPEKPVALGELHAADWYARGVRSPFYNESHRQFRKKVRRDPASPAVTDRAGARTLSFAGARVRRQGADALRQRVGRGAPSPQAAAQRGHTTDEQAGTYPPELHEKAYAAGILGSVWPAEFGGTPPEKLDTFHDLILWDELARCGRCALRLHTHARAQHGSGAR